MSSKQAHLVIFASVNGRDGWHPLAPAEVPAWVKDPETMGRLVAGEMCMDTAQGDQGSSWYRAERAQ